MNVKCLASAWRFVFFVILASIGWAAAASAQTVYEDYTFTTLAGPGMIGPGWFDGNGSAARLDGPAGMARDASGNLYVADSINNTIRKITPMGDVTTLAGMPGVSGTTDGLGGAARFNVPFAVAVDSNGNVYVADQANHAIRKISPAGNVTTFAGLPGTRGSADGTNSTARFAFPSGIAVDSGNNVYVADTGNDTIRKITPNGVVTTFAGTAGVAGSADKKGSSASFRNPFGLAVDANGNVYVADWGNDTIREITPAAVVSTIAGLAGVPGVADGSNGIARLDAPEGVTVDANFNVYVTDTSSHTIRKITPDGNVSTPAGYPLQSGSVDNTGNSARFNTPIGIAVDGNTNLYVADFGNNTIRKVDAGLAVTTPIGMAGGSGSVDATGSAARFNSPAGVAVGANGVVFVADFANETIRTVTPGGTVTTFAGQVGVTGANNANGLAATFNGPVGLTLDKGGNLFVADDHNNAIRKITPAGDVSTFAGLPGSAPGTNDGFGTDARFSSPLSVSADTNGNVFVADINNQTVRMITPAGQVSTYAGIPLVKGTNDGPAFSATFNAPKGVAVDSSHNVYVVDNANATIRKIASDLSVSTFTGTPLVPGSTDGTGTAAMFYGPFAAAVDASGNVYVSDAGNETIRKITPAGVVTTIAGVPGQAGNLDGTGSDASFNLPEGLAVDAQGNVYVADSVNHSIRKGSPALPDRPVVDLAYARTGVTRHFSISNQTTTSWSWSIVRRPTDSTAQLSATNTANPTFTPDVEDAYIIQFQGWDNSGRTVIRRLKVVADDTAPSLTITNPPAGGIVSNLVVTVAGNAKDNFGVSNVWAQVNGGAWVQANGTANWSLDVNLAAGTNVIQAYAVDFAGNISQTNVLGVFCIPSAQLTVAIHGGGTVTPNLNGAILQIGQTYSMTAQAGTGCAFVNWTGPGGFVTNSATLTFVMDTNLVFTANFTDPIPPGVAITSPTKGMNISNAVFTATGTATDNGQLAAVWYQLNGGAWMMATNTSNWTAGLSLTQSNNTLAVYSIDTFNNVSPTNSVAFTWVPSGKIRVIATGQGTISPNYDGWYLQIGKSYSMTAKATVNSIFSGWTDGAGNLLTTSPTITFLVQSNTTFGANFIANPFANLVGPFAGLFYDTNNVGVMNSGFISVTLAFSGSFSAKMQLASGQNVSFSGQLSPSGVYSNSVAPKGAAPYTVKLQMDSLNGGRFTGSVSQNGWTSPLLAVRAAYSPAHPAPEAGKKYTLVIPGGADSTVQPGGNGYGTLSVNALGNVTFSGVLGDGTKISEKTFINIPGQWPLYSAPYKGVGAIFGWMTFTNLAQTDLNGTLYWCRLPQAGAAMYPGGFTLTNIDAVGSLYSFTNGVALLNLPAGGVAILQHGNPVQSFTNNFTLASNNKATSTNGLSLTITTKTGLFKGTARDPQSGSSISVNGVLLQKQNGAYGAFLQGGQSGAVYLGQ